jgi:hypothetical protein
LLLKNLTNEQHIPGVVFDHEDVAQLFHCLAFWWFDAAGAGSFH